MILVQVATGMVPVADQERAIEFYVEQPGFEKRSDTPFERLGLAAV